MAFRTSEEYKRTWEELRRWGLLLLQDPALPSVAALVAGETVKGSWWGHWRGREIFQVAEQIESHPEVLTAKLLSGKVTFLHKSLWPAFLAVARAGEPWQMQNLPPASRTLLRKVQLQGALEPEQVAASGTVSRSARDAVGELERRLLVHARQVHTEHGAHAKRLESWDHWASRAGHAGPAMATGPGKARLLEAVRAVCRASGGSCRLPWEGAVVR